MKAFRFLAVLLFRYSAGYNNISSDNVLIGYDAGYNSSAGGNVFIGRGAGYNTSGFGNIFLGCNAGYNETGSNKLYIDNSGTCSPLIWGDFNANLATVHGMFGVNTKSPIYPIHVQRTGANACITLDRTDGAKNFVNATATQGAFGTVNNYPLKLVANGRWKMELRSDQSLAMRNGASCTVGGVWINASSRELKEDINDLGADQALDALGKLKTVIYKYKADREDEHVDFIAEDAPDLVASKDRKGMSPMDVVAVLTKVLQEQQKTIDELKQEVTELKAHMKQDQ